MAGVVEKSYAAIGDAGRVGVTGKWYKWLKANNAEKYIWKSEDDLPKTSKSTFKSRNRDYVQSCQS